MTSSSDERVLYTGVYVRVCVCNRGVGGAGWGVGPQGSDLCPPGSSLIHRPGVRRTAVSIIPALCGIPRIPRSSVCRCGAAALVQDQREGADHGAGADHSVVLLKEMKNVEQ